MSKEVHRDTDQDTARVLSDMENVTCPAVTVTTEANRLTLTGPAWSLRWAAPEVVKEEAKPGLPSDIWSAGWVCWEVGELS